MQHHLSRLAPLSKEHVMEHVTSMSGSSLVNAASLFNSIRSAAIRAIVTGLATIALGLGVAGPVGAQTTYLNIAGGGQAGIDPNAPATGPTYLTIYSGQP